MQFVGLIPVCLEAVKTEDITFELQKLTFITLKMLNILFCKNKRLRHAKKLNINMYQKICGLIVSSERKLKVLMKTV